jgi:hypothetical protein
LNNIKKYHYFSKMRKVVLKLGAGKKGGLPENGHMGNGHI